MARIRSIKPDFWTDEKVVELDFVDRLLFIGIWNFADDQGYLDHSPRRIKMQVFPGDNVDVSRALARLTSLGLLDEYESPSGPVLHVANWEKHQRVSNPAKPRFEAHELVSTAQSSAILASTSEPSRVIGKGREGKGEDTCASADAEREFDEWYDAYPRKRGKGQAVKAYRAARKKASAQVLLDALVAQIPTLTAKGPNYVPYPATWLNGERWTDEPDNVHQLRPDADGRIELPPLPKGFFEQ